MDLFHNPERKMLKRVKRIKKVLAKALTGKNKPKSAGMRPDSAFPDPGNFQHYSYAKKSHFKVLGKYSKDLFKVNRDPATCDLKVYQDLLVYAFLKHNLAPGSRILEVGGGNSRLLSKVHRTYECWNVDKFEGLGQGPKDAAQGFYKNIFAYMGDFSEELPAAYFDFVFSISALEHVEPNNKCLYQDIASDIDRVLKKGGYSLHCFDIILDAGLERAYYDYIYHYLSIEGPVPPGWEKRFGLAHEKKKDYRLYVPDIVEAFYRIPGLLCFRPSNNELICLPQTWFMSEVAFNKGWKPLVKRSYHEVGRPTSINILWQK